LVTKSKGIDHLEELDVDVRIGISEWQALVNTIMNLWFH
jgi:hypothetical protein